MESSRSRKSKSKLAGTSIEDPSFTFKKDDSELVCTSTSKSHNTKRNSSGYDTSSVAGPESSWLEQIQFKAQYNHYRTSSYASVVNSSCSLDKVENLRSERLRTRLESTGAGEERERHTLCWNFPRVKLPHIFNTKSLEDILGRNKSPDVRLKIKHKHNRKVCGPATASNSSLSSESAGVISPPVPYLAKIQYQCEITPPSPKINLSTSSSDNYNPSGPANVFLAVPKQGSGKKERTHSRPHSRSRVRVTTTKSDNCINRVTTVPVSIMSSKTSTKKVYAPCGSNSADNLDVLESVHIPTSSSVPLNNSVTQKTKQKKIGFSTRVTPICSPDNEISKISLENRPKLVVASVSFLQRPVSPLPHGLSQLPSPLEGSSAGDTCLESSNNKTSSHVFNKLNNYGNDKIQCRNGNKRSASADSTSTKCEGRYMDSQINQCNNDSANLGLYKSGRPNPDRINFVNFQCCGFDSGDTTRALAPHSQSQTKTQEKCLQEPGSFGGYPLSHVCTSNKGDNSAIDSLNKSRFEHYQRGQDDSNQNQVMGDLQSPQYVKRTAHMFNSRYPSASSSQQNGSTGVDETRKTTPSYLNVSRTISGYSCLSYGGNSSSTSNGHHGGPNGTTIAGRTVPLAQPSHYGKSTTSSNGINFSHNNGSHSHLSESDVIQKYKATAKSTTHGPYDFDRPNAPPLPKTPPPLYSPALTITERGVGHVREIPIVREKSPFILNRIERLCGSTEVMSSWRRTKPQPDPSRGRERNIPITLEDKTIDQDIRVKGSSGIHNFMTDHVSLESELQGEKYARNSKDMVMLESQDKVDGERVWRAIPIHRNGNCDDLNNTSSKIKFEEPKKSPDLQNDNKTKFQSGNIPDSGRASAEGVVGDSDLLLSKRLSTTTTSIVDETAEDHTISKEEEKLKKEPSTVNMNKENEPATLVEKNGEYFLLELNNEKSRLDERVAKASAQLEKLDASSDEAGIIRAAIGKANLLCTKKFKQFRDLCNTNLEQSRQGTLSGETFATKNDDLAGFWDMVLIQVEQLHSMFDELDPNCSPAVKPSRLSSSTTGQKVIPSRRSDTPKSSPSNKSPKPTSSGGNKPKSESSAQRDESRRRLLSEKRKAMKNQKVDPGAELEPDVQIFTPTATN